MSDFIGLASTQRGEVVYEDAETLLVEFPRNRCENCTCSFRPTSLSGSGNSKIAFARSQLEPSNSKHRLAAGQKVLVSVPANRLRIVTSALFGLPLLTGLLGGFVAHHRVVAELAQGAVVLCGFAFGALVSLKLSKLLQRQFYDRLSIIALDC